MDFDNANLTGQLLLATPAMRDPRFDRAVIYICSHDKSGAMGLIINKAKAGLHISDLLERIGIDGDVQVANAQVLNGGPVDIDRGFVLHSPDYFRKDSSLKLSDTLSMTATKDVLEALVKTTAPERAMLAVGYSGWSAGQLEGEIAQNSWLICEAKEDLIFNEDLDGKWNAALAILGISPENLSAFGGRA